MKIVIITEIFNSINFGHTESVYFISGPPIMIKNFKIALLDGGVSENRILSDDWE